MKLKQVKIKNFRGYADETILNIGDITSLIGKNDAGKSTVLEALEIFFNNKLIVLEKEDLSVRADSNSIEITCIFSNFPEKIIIDTTYETSLEQESLLNMNGDLEIKKVFKCTSAKPKPQIYIVCNHPESENCKDLLQLKLANLKKRAVELLVDSSTYDARISASVRAAIIEKEQGKNTKTLQNILVDNEDAKKIFATLETYLPVYALFQSDRASSDSDKEIVDPMNVAIKQALLGLEEEMNKIKTEVQKKALETANLTLEKLKEMNKELADSLVPEFKAEPKFDSLFKLTINSDDNISINKRGSGVRRLILLSFFRAEAERVLSENEKNNDIIYAFEEPETSQHPSHQKILIESFLELSAQENCQILLTTHTPALGELLPLESLRLIEKEDNQAFIRDAEESTYEKIRDTLGVLSEQIPNTAKGIILVEGKTDIIFLNHICHLLKENEEITHTLKEKNIEIIPTGGCDNLKVWVTQDIVRRLNLPFAIIMDSDKNYQDEVTKNTKAIQANKAKGIIAYYTLKREAENYLHPMLFDGEVQIEDFNDVKKLVNLYDRQVSKSNVLEKYWGKMSFRQFRDRETYMDDSNEERFELTEIIHELLSIV